MPVEPTFRRIHEVGGRPNYYWKGVPDPEGRPHDPEDRGRNA
jgi:hypothetical protein